jgi:hypothetical protein
MGDNQSTWLLPKLEAKTTAKDTCEKQQRDKDMYHGNHNLETQVIEEILHGPSF